jgi:hypothetical protein
MNRIPTLLLTVLLTIPFSLHALAGEAHLPADADRLVHAFDNKAASIRDKAEMEIMPHRSETIRKLKTLQDKYCRAAKLDEALAIREAIREIRGVLSDPGALYVTESDIGKSMIYEVTGSTTGSVWGTEVYTSDSHLGTVAVHSGLLQPGQVGLIKVRVIRGQRSYQPSTLNGVTSMEYGPWAVSFTVERFKESLP